MTATPVAHQPGAGTTRPVRASMIIAAVIVAIAAAVAILVSFGPAEGESGVPGSDAEPATVEHIPGSDLARITLTERASERLDIQTAPTSTRGVGSAQRLVVPYSSLIYDADGGTWAYTSPEALVFERVAVAVASIKGDRVFLTEGPPPGTQVVTVGAAELFGAELGIGH